MNEDDKIWFSVVIPLYNKKPHIADSITSVLEQSYPHFEVIVVNDASTDGSREIVESFSDNRIQIIDRTTPGPGGYAARNCGIQNAKHHYIAFLDADDTWAPPFLEIMSGLINKNPSVGFYASGWVEKSEVMGEVVSSYARKYSHKGTHTLDLNYFLESYTRDAGPVCSSVAIVDKNLIERAGLFPEDKCRFGGDIDTWFRIMLEGDALLVFPEPLGVYNKEAVNMTTKKNAMSVAETCVKITAESLQGRFTSTQRKLIKRFVNHFQFLQIKKKAMACRLTTQDMRFAYKWVNPMKYLIFFSYSCFHPRLQRGFIQIYNLFK